MKQLIKTAAFAILFSFMAVISFAQQNPRWLSEKGYWVIEGNKNTPKNHVVKFYNNSNVLVYKETLTGVKINPEKRKVKMKLKQVLEQSVLAWEKDQKPAEEMAYVSAILK